ncbi:hypothetical protein EYC84_009127 [Monilinia fructicola]|uniref:Secreted protein n=1 Tax=Monilinia fructicola TaxID=38448 RepID=A0A5M9JD91_MONFR|nr:hypothetical protein EYC84_009127 [Monilinia fructicola]
MISYTHWASLFLLNLFQRPVDAGYQEASSFCVISGSMNFLTKPNTIPSHRIASHQQFTTQTLQRRVKTCHVNKNDTQKVTLPPRRPMPENLPP